MSKILLTGFPGFLGSQLLPRILHREPDASALCLVQEKFMPLAEDRRNTLVAESAELDGRIELAAGDITQRDLGLAAPEVAKDIGEIFHLAAVYDLMVRREIGMAVNVEGTRRVLEFAGNCSKLRRLHYISTCYVSGRHAGIYTEDDLDVGQSFNNYYEETKFLAEVETQAWRNDGLPTTIYRPAIVVGDSNSGETQKYDGPYFVIRWLLRQPKLATLPVVGDPTAARVNLVPRNFVIDAISHLSGEKSSVGKVYQLADPSPLTVDALITEIGRITGRTVIRIPLPKSVAKGALDHVPGMYRLMQIPSASVDYFVHPTHYTSDNTVADLEGTGIEAPPFPSYAGTLVDFVRANPEISSDAMV